MYVVILCGGKRDKINGGNKINPKPLVKIGNKPILWHIIKILQFL